MNTKIMYKIETQHKDYDLIICCGKGIGPNGEIDWVLDGRIHMSLELLKQSPHAQILLSGGMGVTADESGKNMTEADAMEIYILKKYPNLSERIKKETNSQSSLDQLCIIKKEIILPSKYKRIALVTNEFHIDRMSILFDAVLGDGFEVTYFGSKINIYGKYRQLIEDFEKQNLIGSAKIVTLIPRGKEDLFIQYNNCYKDLRKQRIKEGHSKLEFIAPDEVVKFMQSKDIII